jgi:hypothetical protein
MVDPKARSERSPIRSATPYLEVETRPISSLEQVIQQELGQASRAATTNQRNGGDRVRRPGPESSREPRRVT